MDTISSAELAAQCWCDPETSGIEMDVRLAEAFTKRLDAKDTRIAELEAQLKTAKRDAVLELKNNWLQVWVELNWQQEKELTDYD